MSPDVQRQQQPPIAQYAQSAAANGAGGNGAPPTAQFVKQALTQIAELMAKIAKILQVERPELIPVLKQMAGAGKALENDLSKTQGQGSPSSPSSDPAQSAPEDPGSIGLN